MERYDMIHRQTFHIFEKSTRPSSAPSIAQHHRRHSHLQPTDITSHLHHQRGTTEQEKLFLNTIQRDKSSFHKKTSTNFESLKQSDETLRSSSPNTPEHHFDTFTKVWHLSAQYLTHPFHKTERKLEEHQSGFYETFSSFKPSTKQPVTEPYSTTLKNFRQRPHTAQPHTSTQTISSKSRPRSAIIPNSILEDIHNPIYQMKEIDRFEHRLKTLFQ